MFRKSDRLLLEVYIDVDYAGLIIDKRSVIGYCIFLGGNLVTWRSKIQNVIVKMKN